jgi:hypothetical protein
MSARTKIDRKAEALIAALLSEPTHAAAAVKAGVSEATAQRWLRKPEFQAAYRAARRAVVESAVGRLQQVTAEAVEVLRRNMTCGHAAVEVRAAVAVIEKAIEGVELIDLMARLDELEQRMDEVQDDESEDPRRQVLGPLRGNPGCGCRARATIRGVGADPQ